VSADADGRRVRLECKLDDGVVVEHEIIARADEVEFRITATNSTDKASEVDSDVNPRPLSDDVPSNGLIGCFSADEKMILAVAFEPYQELFQGVIACIHSDFRIGGLRPGETKKIHGKLYIMPADVDALLKRYEKDFPGQAR
jgi:hypothetical protein